MLLLFAKGTYVLLSIVLAALSLWSLVGAVVIDHETVAVESVALAGVRLLGVFALWALADRFYVWAKARAEFY